MLSREQLREVALQLENDGNFHAHYRTRSHREAPPHTRRETFYRALQNHFPRLWKSSGESCVESLRLYFDFRWGIPHVDGWVAPSPHHPPDWPDWPDWPRQPSAPAAERALKLRDYSFLPAGTQVVLRSGDVYTLGPHPLAEHVRWVPHNPIFGWKTTHADRVNPDWGHWPPCGVSEVEGVSQCDIVGYFPSSVPQPELEPEPQPETITMTASSVSPIAVVTKTFVDGVEASTLTAAQIYERIAAEEATIERLSAIKTKPKALVKELNTRQTGIEALVAVLDARDNA
jgi:hypothetical protein